jgi:pyruvate-formate lyase-activating enzyme
MKIVGYIQEGFQEYEDHISVILFSLGCNLKCVGCYNYGHIINPDNVLGSAIEMIDRLATPLHDAIVFLGGEPTIWEEGLPEACRHARSKGLLTKVYTNGYNAHVVKALNESELVDAYSVDMKAVMNVGPILGKAISVDEYLTAVNETIDDILAHKIPMEIRTTAWIEYPDVSAVKAYVRDKYPGVTHILQKDFRTNLPSETEICHRNSDDEYRKGRES